MAVADWAALALLLGVVGASAAYLIKAEASVVRKISFGPPLIGFVAAGLAVCFLAMPPFSLEGGRLLYLPSAFATMIFAFVIAPYLSRPLVRASAIAIILLGAVFTYFNGTLYRNAGQACQNTVEWFRANQPPSGTVVILAPDSVAGKYIWRNGIPGALSEFAPGWSVRPLVLAAYLKSTDGPAMMASRFIDLGEIKTGPIQRFSVPESTARLSHATLVYIRVNGSVDRIDGVEVLVPSTL